MTDIAGKKVFGASSPANPAFTTPDPCRKWWKNSKEFKKKEKRKKKKEKREWIF